MNLLLLKRLDNFISLVIIYLVNRVYFRRSFYRKVYNLITFNEVKWLNSLVRFCLRTVLQIYLILNIFFAWSELQSLQTDDEVFLYQWDNEYIINLKKSISLAMIFSISYFSFLLPQYIVGEKLKKFETKEILSDKDLFQLISFLFIYTQSYDRVRINRKILLLIKPYLNDIDETKAKHIVTCYDKYLKRFYNHYSIKPYRVFPYKVKWSLNYQVQHEIKDILYGIKLNYHISPWKIKFM